MKKRNILSALLCSMCLITANSIPAMADAVKVVTLGADLTQDQKNTMMRYFKVDSNQVQTLTITNQDERDHLSAYVPLEQIGTRTVSCAYVKPTTSGGIKVRTANLNWVTCNMIATTLSTSGVSNCEVVAACPFEVSGTGALTGILMAYESASGEKLDETKKEIATEEMVVTGNLAEQIGQDDATNIINQAKMQVVQNNIQDADEIYNIVVNIAEQNNMQVGSDQLDKIVSLLEEIAQQNYNYDDMKETLETVEQNVTGEADDTTDELDEDSIVGDLDESILGDDVIASSTVDPTLEEETRTEESDDEWDYVESNGDEETLAEESEGNTEDAASEDEWDTEDYSSEDGWDTEDTGSEDTWNEETSDSDSGWDTEDTGSDGEWYEENPEEGDASVDTLSADSLSEESKALYERAKTFCAGEYEGDAASLTSAMGEGAVASVTLDGETGAKVSERVLQEYLKVLNDGGASYVSSDSDVYMTAELNMIDSAMKKVFGLETDDSGAEDVLANVTEEEKSLLYSDTMTFFENLYGESAKSYDELVETDMAE
ncbi:MAG: DUF1002 domain-containing protein [Eubacteriales bacterium]|nr:DUF1002 domain-containing protein [Eubacteriales bacterium]